MQPLLADAVTAPITVQMWRDYDPRVREIPGMALGYRSLTGHRGDEVDALYDAGVRCVRLTDEVDLSAQAPAGALILIRELTSRSIAVEWVGRCDDPSAPIQRLSHLYPPSAVLGSPAATAALRVWWNRFFPCKCVFRVGPGFLEVRDRRFGNLEVYTIDEPGHLDAVRRLVEGVPADGIDPGVRHELAADLIAENDGVLWWLPMRLHRWPFQPLTV